MAATESPLTNSQQWKKRALALQRFNRSGTPQSHYPSTNYSPLAYPEQGTAKLHVQIADGRYQWWLAKGCIHLPEDRLNDRTRSVVLRQMDNAAGGRTLYGRTVTLRRSGSLFARQITTETTVSIWWQKNSVFLGITHRKKLGALGLANHTNKSAKQLQACMTEVISLNLEKNYRGDKTSRHNLNRVILVNVTRIPVFSIEELINDFDQWCLPYWAGWSSEVRFGFRDGSVKNTIANELNCSNSNAMRTIHLHITQHLRDEAWRFVTKSVKLPKVAFFWVRRTVLT